MRHHVPAYIENAIRPIKTDPRVGLLIVRGHAVVPTFLSASERYVFGHADAIGDARFVRALAYEFSLGSLCFSFLGLQLGARRLDWGVSDSILALANARQRAVL